MPKLWVLCARGEVEEVRAALARGEDVNAPDGIRDSNRTPLMCAVDSFSDHPLHEKHVSVVKLLLEQPSIDVNQAGHGGTTALHLATVHGNLEAVRLLLADQRLDVNCKDWKQTTPLIIAAAKESQIEIFKLLLAEPKVDVNCVSSNPAMPPFGRAWHGMAPIGEVTALMISSMSSNVEATKLLLDDQRVDLSWPHGTSGLSVLHRLVTNSRVNLKLLELFLAHPRVDVNGRYGPLGLTILHLAAVLCRNVDVVKLILAEPRFNSANAPNGDGIPAVAAAAIKGHWDVLKVLVEHPSIELVGDLTR